MGDDFMKQRIVRDREYWLKRIEEISASEDSYKKTQKLLEAETKLSKLGKLFYNPNKTIGYGKNATTVSIPYVKVKPDANN